MFEPNSVDKYLRINPQTRMFVPAWMYRDILPFSLGPDPSVIPQNSAISLTTADPRTIPYKLPHTSLDMDHGVGNPLNIDQISYSEFLTGVPNAAFTIMINDMGDQRQFMNAPVHIRSLAGTGRLAARLSEDLFLPTRHQLNITLRKTPGAFDQSARVYFHGSQYYTWSSNLQSHKEDHTEMLRIINKHLERRKYVFPYWMTTEGGVVNVPANQTVENDALVGSEGHLECTHITRAYPSSGDQTTAPFELELVNPQTRQSLMNGKIHSYMIGDASNPQPLPVPFRIPAGQLLRFIIKDLSGSTNPVYITLRARKIRAEFKDIDQVKREFGIGTNVKAPVSRKAEMNGII